MDETKFVIFLNEYISNNLTIRQIAYPNPSKCLKEGWNTYSRLENNTKNHIVATFTESSKQTYDEVQESSTVWKLRERSIGRL